MFYLPAFAFAELIDNALAATVDNPRSRKIDIRLVSVEMECTAYTIQNAWI